MNDAEEMKEEELGDHRGRDPRPPMQEGAGNPRGPREEAHKEIEQGGLCDPVADSVGGSGKDGGHGEPAKNQSEAAQKIMEGMHGIHPEQE
jgi:hypothetical protein